MTARACLVPQLAVPVLQVADLRSSLAWYTGSLGWTLAQHVPGVVSLLRLDAVRLQLWQVPDAPAQECRVPLEGPPCQIFRCHSRMTRAARTWIADAPVLQPWGEWQFGVVDVDGHRLCFTQWAHGGSVFGCGGPTRGPR